MEEGSLCSSFLIIFHIESSMLFTETANFVYKIFCGVREGFAFGPFLFIMHISGPQSRTRELS